MNKKIIISVVLLLFISSVFAINDDAGTTGFSFLKMRYYAKAAAMANAYSAASSDVNSVFYNPAGIAKLSQKMISSTYMSYFDGINCGSVAYGTNYKNGFKLGFYAQYLSATEDRTLIDENGNYAGTDGSFGASDLLAGIALAKTINPQLDIGFSLKYLRESLDDTNASAILLDAALLHQTANENLTIGAAIRNFGAQITYFTDSDYKENLPTTYVIGFHYLVSQKISANLDIQKPAKNDAYGCIGLEYRWNEKFSLRSGYKTNATDWKKGGDSEFLSGLSFGFGMLWKKMQIDYAIVSYGDLGLVNQISLGYLF